MKNMVKLLQPEIYKTFKSIYNEIKDSSETKYGLLIPFQNTIAKIPKWDENKLIEILNGLTSENK